MIAFSSPHPCTLQRHPEGSRVACSPPPCRPPRGQRLREWTPREHCLRQCDTRLHSHGCRQAATILVLDCSMPANVTINGGPSRTHVQCYQCSDSGHREVLSGCVNNHCWAAKRSSSTVFLRLAPCWACQQKSCATSDWRAQNKDPPTELLRLVRCGVGGGMGTYQGQLSPEGPQV